VAGSCKYGDEPLGSGTTEVVNTRYLFGSSVIVLIRSQSIIIYLILPFRVLFCNNGISN
jgi:hypothetical protein